MVWTILKWLLPILALVIVAGQFTSRTFHVESIIPAPPEKVWAVLTDNQAYPEWNPVFVEVQGAYAEGAKVLNRVRDPDGKFMEMTATVKALTKTRELRQTGGLPGVITFDHQWLLEPVEGGTKVIQHEIDRGFYLWFWNSDWIEPGYRSVNEALAARVQNTTK